MKYLIIIAITMLIACDDDSPDSSDENISEVKYTIEELENDPDWVEVTDVDTVGMVCALINKPAPNRSFVIRTEEDFSKLEKIKIVKESCYNDILPQVDFSENVLIASDFTYRNSELERKIFKNSNMKQIRYIFSIKWDRDKQQSGRLETWKECIAFKAGSDYSIICDTLQLDVED